MKLRIRRKQYKFNKLCVHRALCMNGRSWQCKLKGIAPIHETDCLRCKLFSARWKPKLLRALRKDCIKEAHCIPISYNPNINWHFV